ncbi:MAG TPA: isocitrate lyase/phosphoenolpyruvate mutase family protein [Opitutaceae bacterium]|jgi:2-methylisocitrate lyase-like PEP mutase family enzyme
MQNDLSNRAAAFRKLHDGPVPLLIANPWDAGSARIFATLGFRALATSSGASAAVLGRKDGELSREAALAHAASIVAATELPVSADLENGFGPRPEDANETIRRAAEIGLCGGSIEDFSGNDRTGLFDFTLAVERVSAVAEAVRSLPFPFTFTARTEGYLRGRPSLDETIKRLSAFERAGADVLFAPGLPDLDAVRTVCNAVKKPINFMVGLRGKSFSVAELQAVGVRRISFGGSLYRAAVGGLISAAKEIQNQGTFGFLETAPSTPDLYRLLAPPK